MKKLQIGKLLGIPFGQFDESLARSCDPGNDSYGQPVAAFTMDINHK